MRKYKLTPADDDENPSADIRKRKSGRKNGGASSTKKSGDGMNDKKQQLSTDEQEGKQ
jgi:hypothetical protein